jgi:hypothetical protein
MFDPVAKKIVQSNAWPDPNGSGTVNNFAESLSPATVQNGYSIRIDQNISDKSRFFARWGQRRESTPPSGAEEWLGASNQAGPGANAPNNRWEAAAGYTRTISPTFVMSINGGYGVWVEERVNQGSPFKPSTLGLPSYLDIAPGNYPVISPDGTYGLGQGTPVEATPREAGSVAIDFTKTIQQHAFKFGIMWTPTQNNDEVTFSTGFTFPRSMTEGPDPTAANTQTGWGFASFLLGTGSSGYGKEVAGSVYHQNSYGLYFEDDWTPKPHLTLNLGARYEVQKAPTDRHDRLSWFDYSASNPISSAVGFNVPGELVYVGDGRRRGLYEPQLTNLAPRLGATYLLKSKLVLRTGFGMFYAPAISYASYQDINLNGFSETTPYAGTTDGITPSNLLSNPFPNGLITPPGKSQGGLTNVGLDTSATGNSRPTPYVFQWTFGTEYAIAPNTSLSVTYVGNHGAKLLYDGINENQLSHADMALGNALLDQVSNPFYGQISTSGCGLDQPTVTRGQLLRPYPEFCAVEARQTPDSSSSYEAMIVEFKHRWSRGVQIAASYTLSKYESDSEGPAGWAAGNAAYLMDSYNTALVKSLDAADTPNSFVVNFVAELPFGRGKHFGASLNKPLDAVLGGWQFSGIGSYKNGFPLAIDCNTDNSNSLGNGLQRPDLIANPSVAHRTINEWFNTAAFAQPAAYTFGTAARTIGNIRAPGINNWDAGIQKWWTFHEDLKAQFRAEMFNAFNHPNFFEPDQGLGDPGFGTITGAEPARDVQFALKIYW